MFKKLILALAAMIAMMSFAFAQVDVNKADQAALDGIKGIGPKTSKTIIDERAKNGPFKDWADFEKRVKGIGEKNSTKLSEAGLTVNGQSKGKSAAASTAAKDTKPAAEGGKDASKNTKPSATSSGKEAKPASDTKK